MGKNRKKGNYLKNLYEKQNKIRNLLLFCIKIRIMNLPELTPGFAQQNHVCTTSFQKNEMGMFLVSVVLKPFYNIMISLCSCWKS
ncbi:MAG: hypothetical protein AYK18_05445 [Theionarchaea archaeon DG-70]|nr:MAG: hypothetical protein AYK18_05445 [Theionarchaea archaeon DG-70]